MVFRSRRLGAVSVSAKVGADDEKPRSDKGGDRVPYDVGLRIAVQQQKRLSLPARNDVYVGAARSDRFLRETVRKHLLGILFKREIIYRKRNGIRARSGLAVYYFVMSVGDDLLEDLDRLYSASPPLAREAFRIQKELSRMVEFSRPGRIRTVAGADIAVLKKERKLVCGVVVFSYPDLRETERAHAVSDEKFPYIPGLLGFREAPCVMEACRKLESGFDLLMIDGHGLAHPRGFGLACHVGVLLDAPTIGVAKKPLYGTFEEPGAEKGHTALIMGKDGRRPVGAALRTRDGVRPVFVSAGHKTDLETAVAVALECSRGYRIPEPTRIADKYAASLKKENTESRFQDE